MIAAIIVFVVAVPLRFRRWRTGSSYQSARWQSRAVMFSSAAQYLEVARGVQQGGVQSVEGRITNFAQAARRHPVESFELGGQHFAYRDELLAPGYGGTQLFGGGVRAGMRARVAYYDAAWHERVITKLEIAE